jgi:2-keto-4-pentenoate hydratase
MSAFDAARAAAFVADAHAKRDAYCNLPENIAPRTIAEAYAAQEALVARWLPALGTVAGRKIATTTRVMQELMGIDHPCGGTVFASRVHKSGATLRLADFMHVVIECELAVSIARDIPAKSAPFTRDTVRPYIGGVAASFELIEDRNAHYRSTDPRSMIADNCWNGGIVVGEMCPLATGQVVDGIEGTLTIDGEIKHRGKTDDPFGALAWVVNLGNERGRPLRAGEIVITGSCIPTLPIAAGQSFTFTLAGLGDVSITAA